MKNKLFPSITTKPFKSRKFAAFGVFDSSIDSFFDSMQMSDVKRDYKPAKLYPEKPKDGARYYISFWAYDESTDRLKEKVIWLPSELKTDKDKRFYAAPIISQINARLAAGLCFRDEKKKEELTNTVGKNILSALNEALPIKQAEVRNTSEDTYKSMFRKFEKYLIKKGLKEMYIADFDESNILNYRTYLISELGNVSRTANNSIISIGALFGICKTLKYIEKNPFEKFPSLPETDTEVHEVFTPEHQKILENWLIENDPVLYLFTRFQYHAFVRPKEIRMLRVKNIDLKRKQLLINSGIAKNKKNGIVPLSKTLYMDFVSVINAHKVPAQNVYIFGRLLQMFGEFPLSENYAYNRHCLALEACKLDGFNYTLYSWKHTGACRAIEAGVNVRKLQGLLRHSSLEETDRYLKSLGIALQNEPLKETW